MAISITACCSAWRALDRVNSGWATLQDFDEPSYRAMKKFRAECIQRAESVMKLLAKIDAGQNGFPTPEAIMSECRNMTEEEIAIVTGKRGERSIQQYRRIDAWDLDWEREDEDRRTKMAIQSAARRQNDESGTPPKIRHSL
jgi:hypothetical protein